MLTLVTTTQFRKDYKRAKKRGMDLSRVESVLELLCAEEILPAALRDHPQTGNYTGFRECHIQPDWLLVYEIRKDQLILVASRTGSHADLFGK